MSLMQFDEKIFQERFNRQPFLFRHSLSTLPEMQMSSLFDLALRHPRHEVRHWRGDIPVTANFDNAPETHGTGIALEDAIANIEKTGSYVLIRNAHLDRRIGELTSAVIADIHPYFDKIDSAICEQVAYIFISAPGANTPYHQDREINFLCHLHGRKRVTVWDPRDSTILPYKGVEQLFARYDAPKPAYREEFQARGEQFELEPGMGVHHPFIAPHSVKNGDQVSASIAITFRSQATKFESAVHFVNYHLRSLKLDPTPYGQSKRRDQLKYKALSAYRSAKAFLIKPQPGPHRS